MFDLDHLLPEPNEFRVCDKCKATRLKTLIPKLQAIDPEAKINIGCQSYCGPGRDRVFSFVNNKPLIGETEEQLIEKIKEFLENNCCEG